MNNKVVLLTPRAIILVILAMFLIGLSIAPARELLRQRKELNNLEQELAAIKGENQNLRDEVERLNTDDYIEQQARARLGLIKPGEKAYVIVPPKQENQKSQEEKSLDKSGENTDESTANDDSTNKKSEKDESSKSSKPTEKKGFLDTIYDFFKNIWE